MGGSGQYLAHFKNSLFVDCYLGISHNLRILFLWIVPLVSRTRIAFSFKFLEDCELK